MATALESDAQAVTGANAAADEPGSSKKLTKKAKTKKSARPAPPSDSPRIARGLR
jgi:hypothetical protein